MNCEESVDQISDEFKSWVKKFSEEHYKKNQALKSCLQVKQQINAELKNNIEKLSKNSLNSSTLAIDVVATKVKTRIEADLNYLKIKSEQLNKCNETLNTTVEDETKKMREKFYNMIIRDDLALKPFYEVEEAIKVLNDKIDFCTKTRNDEKENFVKMLKERELSYTEVKQSIVMLEPLAQEIDINIQNVKKKFEEKLKYLKLKGVEEASSESKEATELLVDITAMKSQLINTR